MSNPPDDQVDVDARAILRKLESNPSGASLEELAAWTKIPEKHAGPAILRLRLRGKVQMHKSKVKNRNLTIYKLRPEPDTPAP